MSPFSLIPLCWTLPVSSCYVSWEVTALAFLIYLNNHTLDHLRNSSFETLHLDISFDLYNGHCPFGNKKSKVQKKWLKVTYLGRIKIKSFPALSCYAVDELVFGWVLRAPALAQS